MVDVDQLDNIAETQLKDDAVMQFLITDEVVKTVVTAAKIGDDVSMDLVRGMIEQISNESFKTGFRRGHVSGMSTAIDAFKGMVE